MAAAYYWTERDPAVEWFATVPFGIDPQGMTDGLKLWEESPMAKKVYASLTKFQGQIGPWDHVGEGAYHQFLKG